MRAVRRFVGEDAWAMLGRSTFTASEAAELRELIGEKQTTDRTRQKTLRARMRRIGFYISDFADYAGFTVSDFDDLVSRGVVTIEEADAGSGGGPLSIGEGDNADSTKETLDFFIRDGAGGMRRVRSSDDVREYLRMSGMTVDEFKRLPAYRLALRQHPWLREL